MDTQNNRQPPSSNAVDHHHEHMFEKPLTPSDVGKLNRLVIPKQHAEKYFPMADQYNGLVLSFEDEFGKLWRFRYSYWNSSQSYVLTKGWRRYVKEKRLDAGDVVMFQRHVLDCERMFIGWRPRVAAMPGQDRLAAAQPVGGGHAAQLSEMCYDSHLRDGAVEMYENVDTYQRREVVTRRLRLFGVTLECQDDSNPSDPYGSSHGGQSDNEYNLGFNNLHNMMRYHQHEG